MSGEEDSVRARVGAHERDRSGSAFLLRTRVAQVPTETTAGRVV